jgi:IS30 family transposase
MFSISNNLARNKLGRSYNPGRPLGMFDRRKILALYQRGLKISHIAKIIGVTHSCVSKIMTRYRRYAKCKRKTFFKFIIFPEPAQSTQGRHKFPAESAADMKTTSSN